MPVSRKRRAAWLLGALLAGLVTAGPATAETLVIGSVSDEPASEMERWLPFARFVAGQLGDAGITDGTVFVAPGVAEMAAKMRSGEVDLYIDSPISVLMVGNKAGTRIIARRWKFGVSAYTSVIFTRADSELSAIEQLPGATIAFQTPYSSTAYILPRLALTAKGLSLQPLSSPYQDPDPDKVGYVFSQKDEDTIAWVIYGTVDAGAASNEDLDELDPAVRARLKVIHETEPIPRHVVSARADLPADLVERIREVLFAMDESAEGRAVLEAFEETAQFDPLPDDMMEVLERYRPILGTIPDN